MEFNPTTIERFWAKVDKNGPLWHTTPCWLWTGSLHPILGYGQLYIGGSRHVTGAHRVAYELLAAPLPEDPNRTIDHLCRNRGCVNPEHLELVSRGENVRRGLAGITNNNSARKTHCPAGHAYDLFNTYRKPDGKRVCRKCRSIRKRLRHQDSTTVTVEVPLSS